MKKSILALLLCLTTLSLTSCWDNDSVDEDYVEIYSGLVLYVAASNTNEIALDALSVASRLGMLLNEVEEFNIDNNLTGDDLIVIGGESDEDVLDQIGSVTFGGTTYQRRALLIGTETNAKIWRDGNVYYIQYGTLTSDGTYDLTDASYDNLYRQCTFMIDTKGVMLDDADVDTCWEVNAVDGKIDYATGNSGVNTVEYSCNYSSPMKVYYGDISAEGDDPTYGLIYSTDLISPVVENSDGSDASWTMNGTLHLVDFEDGSSFNITNTKDLRYELYIKASGKPMSAPAMTFETVVPYEYRPSTGDYTKYNSEIHVKLNSTSDEYVAKDVYVQLLNDGSYVVDYNDTIWYEN